MVKNYIPVSGATEGPQVCTDVILHCLDERKLPREEFVQGFGQSTLTAPRPCTQDAEFVARLKLFILRSRCLQPFHNISLNGRFKGARRATAAACSASQGRICSCATTASTCLRGIKPTRTFAAYSKTSLLNLRPDQRRSSQVPRTV